MKIMSHNVTKIDISQRTLTTSAGGRGTFLALDILVTDINGQQFELTLFPRDDYELTIPPEVLEHVDPNPITD